MIVPEAFSGVAFGDAHDGDPRTDVTARHRISTTLGIAREWAWPRQVHGRVALTVSATGVVGEGDAVITTRPEIPVAVSVADCVPVGLTGPGAAAMVHCGWRGAAARIVEAVVEQMTEAGAPPTRAVIGPGIAPCCFEVGAEVAEIFPEHIATTTWGTTSVDLAGAIRSQLSGIEVVSVGSCTHHDERFHSFRRDGTDRRQFGVAWVAPD